jgi:hypothetical protein
MAGVFAVVTPDRVGTQVCRIFFHSVASTLPDAKSTARVVVGNANGGVNGSVEFRHVFACLPGRNTTGKAGRLCKYPQLGSRA